MTYAPRKLSMKRGTKRARKVKTVVKVEPAVEPVIVTPEVLKLDAHGARIANQ